MLQDICKATHSLPTSYYLQGIMLKHCLGRGGEACTYRGTLRKYSRFHEIVLRKVFLPSDDTQPSASDKLVCNLLSMVISASAHFNQILPCIRREIITHRQLNHQNIIPLLGVYHADDHPLIIITPWLRNGHALEYLEKNGTPSVYLHIVLTHCFSTSHNETHSQGLGSWRQHGSRVPPFKRPSGHPR
jgi:serine/threonine protein kinase